MRLRTCCGESDWIPRRATGDWRSRGPCLHIRREANGERLAYTIGRRIWPGTAEHLIIGLGRG